MEATLLRVTQDLLVEEGYDGLSIEAVAARARTSKHTIYRRWANKADLVVAAVGQARSLPPLPDTGSLEGDLFACARSYIDGDERTEQLLVGLLREMMRSEALRAAAWTGLGAPYLELFRTVLHRAAVRGQIGPDVDLEVIAQIFPAFAFHAVAVEGRPVDEALVTRVIGGVVLPLLPSV